MSESNSLLTELSDDQTLKLTQQLEEYGICLTCHCMLKWKIRGEGTVRQRWAPKQVVVGHGTFA